MSAVRKFNKKVIDEKLLSWFSPFQNLELDQLKQLAEKFQMRHMLADRVLFRRGDNDSFSYFLVAGEIELSSRQIGQLRLKSGTTAAREPIAEIRPRRVEVRTTRPCTIIYIDSHILDLYTKKEDLGSYEVAEINQADESDWLTTFLCSINSNRLPAKNIQTLMSNLEEVPVRKGEAIFEQHDPDDHYYIVKDGRCLVSRQSAKNEVTHIAELKQGCGFGEEAIISQGRRNASVTMLEDGTLMRLSKVDFLKLLVDPILDVIVYSEMHSLMNNGAKLLDVRTDKNRKQWLRGSCFMPITQLRDRLQELDRNQLHIVYCDDGLQSSAAAFLLTQHGYHVCILQGGLTNANKKSGLMQASQASDGSQMLSIDDDENTPAKRKKANAKANKGPGFLDNIYTGSTEPDFQERYETATREMESMRQEAEQARQRAEQEIVLLRGRELAAGRKIQTLVVEHGQQLAEKDGSYRKLVFHYRKLRNELAQTKAQSGKKDKEIFLAEEKYEQVITSLNQQLTESSNELAQANWEVNERSKLYQQQKRKLENLVSDEQEKRQDASDQTHLAREHILALEQELADLQNDHISEISTMQDQHDKVRSQLQTSLADLEEEQRELRQRLDEGLELEAESQHLRAEVNRLESMALQYEATTTELQQELESLQQREQNLDLQNQSLRDEVSRLEDLLHHSETENSPSNPDRPAAVASNVVTLGADSILDVQFLGQQTTDPVVDTFLSHIQFAGPAAAEVTESVEAKNLETESLEIENRETNIPQAESPEIEHQETSIPETESPEIEYQETSIPETESPEIDHQENNTPEAESPETEYLTTENPVTNESITETVEASEYETIWPVIYPGENVPDIERVSAEETQKDTTAEVNTNTDGTQNSEEKPEYVSSHALYWGEVTEGVTEDHCNVTQLADADTSEDHGQESEFTSFYSLDQDITAVDATDTSDTADTNYTACETELDEDKPVYISFHKLEETANTLLNQPVEHYLGEVAEGAETHASGNGIAVTATSTTPDVAGKPGLALWRKMKTWINSAYKPSTKKKPSPYIHNNNNEN